MGWGVLAPGWHLGSGCRWVCNGSRSYTHYRFWLCTPSSHPQDKCEQWKEEEKARRMAEFKDKRPGRYKVQKRWMKKMS